MKSCLGLMLSLMIFVLVLGGGALIWYLSQSAEFTRKAEGSAASTAMPPRAVPVRPAAAAPVRPPVAVPARR